MLVDSFLAGGAERIAVEVACRLDRDRIEPFVIATRSSGPLEANLELADVPYAVLGRHRGFSPRRLLRARRLIVNADVLHAHKYGSNMWGALLARWTRVPLIALEPTFNGVHTPRRVLGYRYWIGPVARRVVCPTAVIARSLEQEEVAPEKIRVIPNGVPLSVTLPRDKARDELGLDLDSKVIGIVARLRVEKCHELLLGAFARLSADRQDVVLAIVGDGVRRAELEELARSLGVDTRVVFAGERRDARRLISAFDVGVISSSWEGLPVAALETMAAGVPLVSTRVGTMPEILADDAGVLVDVGDEEALAAELGRLLDDPDWASRIAARGRARVEQENTFDAMVNAYLELYEAVADETRARVPASTV